MIVLRVQEEEEGNEAEEEEEEELVCAIAMESIKPQRRPPICAKLSTKGSEPNTSINTI